MATLRTRSSAPQVSPSLRKLPNFCVGAVVLLTVLLSACGGTTRSVAAFCQTYHQQKSAYLTKYGGLASQVSSESKTDPLAAVVGGIAGSFSAFGDIKVMFDRLDQVAPSDVEPDVDAVYKSLQQEESSLAAEASNPLGALFSGVITALTTSGSWQRVSNYISANCGA